MGVGGEVKNTESKVNDSSIRKLKKVSYSAGSDS
jgi:hypothetical protein